MADATDPNQVRLTGENSFIRLVETSGGPDTTRTSHWRIWLSPGGAGHVLFMQRMPTTTTPCVSIRTILP